ncbi:MAG: hypothetical protein KJ621_05155 [Proteobacteria bacterium]|nr:hypothetical protein [Pseudomonadota bacterium]MBU1742013.1 hypothetical protein [Pseudomonadota bacterium]
MERLTVFILFLVFNFAGIGLVSTAAPGHDGPAKAAAVTIDRAAEWGSKSDQRDLARQDVVIEDQLALG